MTDNFLDLGLKTELLVQKITAHEMDAEKYGLYHVSIFECVCLGQIWRNVAD